jgi:hypothetical protein
LLVRVLVSGPLEEIVLFVEVLRFHLNGELEDPLGSLEFRHDLEQAFTLLETNRRCISIVNVVRKSEEVGLSENSIVRWVFIKLKCFAELIVWLVESVGEGCFGQNLMGRAANRIVDSLTSFHGVFSEHSIISADLWHVQASFARAPSFRGTVFIFPSL